MQQCTGMQGIHEREDDMRIYVRVVQAGWDHCDGILFGINEVCYQYVVILRTVSPSISFGAVTTVSCRAMKPSDKDPRRVLMSWMSGMGSGIPEYCFHQGLGRGVGVFALARKIFFLPEGILSEYPTG